MKEIIYFHLQLTLLWAHSTGLKEISSQHIIEMHVFFVGQVEIDPALALVSFVTKVSALVDSFCFLGPVAFVMV